MDAMQFIYFISVLTSHAAYTNPTCHIRQKKISTVALARIFLNFLMPMDFLSTKHLSKPMPIQIPAFTYKSRIVKYISLNPIPLGRLGVLCPPP